MRSNQVISARLHWDWDSLYNVGARSVEMNVCNVHRVHNVMLLRLRAQPSNQGICIERLGIVGLVGTKYTDQSK